MARGKMIRETEFRQLKALLNSGVKPSKLGKLYDRSIGTLSYIKNSKSLEDYRSKIHAVYLRGQNKKRSVLSRLFNRGETPHTVSSTPTLDALIRIEAAIKQMRADFEKTVKENL